MAYSDTLTYTIDAASTSMADFMTAIISHFNTAPGLWQIKSGVASVAGEAVTIELKTGTAPDINIRRVSTTDLAVTADEANGITDSGDNATAPTTSATAYPEAQTGDITGLVLSTRFFICEYSDAIAIIFQDSGKTYTPIILHSGIGYEPARGSSDVALGMTGSLNMAGEPSGSAPAGIQEWSSATDVTDGPRIRTYDSGGGAHFDQVYIVDIDDSSGIDNSSTSEDGLIKVVRPAAIRATDVNGNANLFCGLMKYVGYAPYDTTFVAENPLTVLDAASNESWMYIGDAAAIHILVLNVEHNFVPT